VGLDGHMVSDYSVLMVLTRDPMAHCRDTWLNGHMVLTRDPMAHCHDTWLIGHMVAQVQEKVVGIKRWRWWQPSSSLSSDQITT
jgi:hypothetical protein